MAIEEVEKLKTKAVQVELSENLWRRVKAAAVLGGKTTSETVEDALAAAFPAEVDRG